ncbi:MAG: nicotinamide riboside transporter PnuC [Dysgonamonadaceae bacterium]|jgi:nicotinamide mononucleotide transporter|nr:nicotinamide riboside transporter PnuC [Dysgonamonadaceae bacterium]
MDTIEIIGAVIGLLYLYFEYKADKWLWLVGILMPLIYVYIFFHAKFYAYMGINVYYFFASVYGWIKWTRTAGNEVETPILHTPEQKIIPLAAVFSLIFMLITYILIYYTDSPVAIGDSFTTALSIVAMWMLANKYIEQWWLLIVVNAASCGLFFLQGLNYTALLYLIYGIVSFFGYFKWKRLMEKRN